MELGDRQRPTHLAHAALASPGVTFRVVGEVGSAHDACSSMCNVQPDSSSGAYTLGRAGPYGA
jgi:hypothetical protein